jgi:hypothetical protein
MQAKSRIELIPAFSWDCPDCGRENFERAVVSELSAEEMSVLRLQHGVDPLQEGHFLTSPSEVACKHCGREYETVEYGVEQDA